MGDEQPLRADADPADPKTSLGYLDSWIGFCAGAILLGGITFVVTVLPVLNDPSPGLEGLGDFLGGVFLTIVLGALGGGGGCYWLLRRRQRPVADLTAGIAFLLAAPLGPVGFFVQLEAALFALAIVPLLARRIALAMQRGISRKRGGARHVARRDDVPGVEDQVAERVDRFGPAEEDT